MMRRNRFIVAAVFAGFLLMNGVSSPVRAQGKEYGQELGATGKEYGERIKKGLSPDDGKDRAPAQKAGHAAKELGKGTGEFFKGFGRSTAGFFKGIFSK